MRLTYATTTITTTIPTVALFAITTSCHEVTASVNLAHDHSKAHFLRAAPKNDGAECSFVNAFKVHAGVDTGILECNVEETCIEDNTSTLGGRCFMLDKEEFVDMEIPHTASDSPFLTIPCSFINGTSAFKCVGQDACLGVNDFDAIGCGSCIGMFSCKEVAGLIMPHFVSFLQHLSLERTLAMGLVLVINMNNLWATTAAMCVILVQITPQTT
eukprot:CCRYP_000314-RA/>CCRYP_000314-RA protein AED:0.02 eAED:0.02 QI:17/0.5/0.4/1/0.75/0.6/5/247/213